MKTELLDITIDRSTPFDLAKFFGEGEWSINEEDKNALKLKEVDLTKVRMEPMLEEGERYVQGEEKLRRLKKAKHIRLDAKVFQTLWENQDLIPATWKEKTNGNTTYIYFDGTVIRSPSGHRYVLCLCWDGVRWDWLFDWLDYYGWRANCLSAVLAS